MTYSSTSKLVNGSSSSFKAQIDTSEIPDFLKQFVNILLGIELQAFVSKDMVVKIEHFSSWLPFSKAVICFLTARERYLALRARMTP